MEESPNTDWREKYIESQRKYLSLAAAIGSYTTHGPEHFSREDEQAIFARARLLRDGDKAKVHEATH